MARPEWIEVGRVSRPHGVRGEVRVALSSDNPQRFAVGAVLHGRPGRLGVLTPGRAARRMLKVASSRGEASFPIVGFEGVGDRAEAEAIRGYVLEVRGSELPALSDEEFYVFDLVGLEVEDEHGQVVGRVTQTVESPAHELLVVRVDGGEDVLVPFVQEAVPFVRLDEGRVVVGRTYLATAGGGAVRDEAEKRPGNSAKPGEAES